MRVLRIEVDEVTKKMEERKCESNTVGGLGRHLSNIARVFEEKSKVHGKQVGCIFQGESGLLCLMQQVIGQIR